MDYGKELERKRKQNGLSIYRLSKLSGVPGVTISRWEKGKAQPPVNNYSKVLKAMGESIVIGKTE